MNFLEEAETFTFPFGCQQLYSALFIYSSMGSFRAYYWARCLGTCIIGQGTY